MLVVVLFAGCGDHAPPAGKPLERGVWIWDHTVATDSAAAGRLLDFAVAHGVSRLYLQSQSLLSTPSGETALAQFVAQAQARGLATELLFGSADWALAANHSVAVGLARSAVAFTAGAMVTSRPVGVHFDVEPNTLPAWTTDPIGTANQYLDLLDQLSATSVGSGLALTVDFHYSFATLTLTRAGANQPLSRFVAQKTDRGVVMVYRDVAAGPDGLIALSAGAVDTAATEGKPIVIGVNTSCGRPARTSFCPDGNGALERALAQTAAVYANGKIVGFAIHDYAAYAQLGP